MITYELAKQLKDAGFKSGEGNYYICEHDEIEHTPCAMKGKDVYLPLLSELIEACGEKLFENDANTLSLNWYGGNLFTAGTDRKIDWSIEFKATTPEEAVANLWLSLNKKGE